MGLGSEVEKRKRLRGSRVDRKKWRKLVKDVVLYLQRQGVSDWVFFSARCNIYISCLCYDVSVRLSVYLFVMEVYWCNYS